MKLLAKFDPVMKEHLAKVKDGNSHTHTHCLGKDIQNELLNLMSSQLTKEIVAKIHTSTYFSIIFDCTPDISHQEQIPIIIHIVEIHPKPEIK